jgi:hypothetical protein
MRTNSRSIPDGLYVLISISIILFAILAGCASSLPQNQTAPLVQPAFNLKKTFWLLPFENNSGYATSTLLRDFNSILISRIKENHQNNSNIKTIDDRAQIADLAVKSRDRGVCAIIAVELLLLNIEKESRGFWWFKKNEYLLQIQASVGMTDPLTTAKISEEIVKTQTAVNRQTYDAFLQPSDASIDEIDLALSDLLARMAENIDRGLHQIPWISFITAETEGKDGFIIPSGSDSGVKPGLFFDVYANGEQIAGVGGGSYFVPGGKIGVIQISSVDSEQSVAVPFSGEAPYPGCFIRIYNPEAE